MTLCLDVSQGTTSICNCYSYAASVGRSRSARQFFFGWPSSQRYWLDYHTLQSSVCILSPLHTLYVQLVPKIQVGIERQCSAYAVAYFRRIDPASLTVGGSVKYKSPSHEHAVCHRFNPPFLHNTHHVFYFSIHQFVACSCNTCRWRT